MPISVSVHGTGDLTVFKASGHVTFDEQMEALRAFYANEPTPDVLWDFTDIEGIRISRDDLRSLIRYTKKQVGVRPPGKTALVTNSALDYGLARMGSIFSELEDTPWETRAFNDLEDAMKWLRAES